MKKMRFPHIRRPRRIRLSKRSRSIIGGLLGVCILLGILIVPPVLNTYRSALEAKTALMEAKTKLGEQDFKAARVAIDTAERALTHAERSIARLRALQPIPFIGTQVKATQILVDVASILTVALREGTIAGDQIIGPLQQGKGSISFSTLTPADKRQILKRIAESGPQLTSVRTNVLKATARFRDLPDHGLLPQLTRAIEPLREQIPFLEDAVAQLVPATTIIPAIAGFPDPQTYLFLLQNNTELRPTGGFIGTYGILKVASADITSFTTSDVYTLDTPMKDSLHLAPPTPLVKYNDTTQWFFRDSNWSPDFPTAAKKSLELYRLENGPQRAIDGVIAVTPTFVSSLLKISGDITIGSVTFTPENLIDKLQPRADRKELIGEMSTILMKRLMALPQRRWQEVIVALTKALEEKQMLLYSNDTSLQQQIVDQNWGGNLRTGTVDSVYVVDANLASLKTDSVIDRRVDYTMDLDGTTARATASITYTNRGTFTAQTTRYRTYTRLYVPEGSTLTSSSGALQNDKLHGARPGTVDVASEFGKTVFGAFISIEPGTSSTLSFSYTLPPSIAAAVAEGTYELSVQKQPGTRGHALNGTLNFGKTIRAVSGVDGTTMVGHTAIALKSDLVKDRHLRVTF